MVRSTDSARAARIGAMASSANLDSRLALAMHEDDRDLDDDGFIRPEVSLAWVSARYAPVTGQTVKVVRQHLGPRLHSLYLCGSIVKGTAVPHRSDLDALAALHGAPTDADHTAARLAAAEIGAAFPFLADVSIGLWSAEAILSEDERYDMGFFVKCLCVCVDGVDLGARLPRYTPSLALARGTNGNIGQLVADRRARLAALDDPAGIRFICRGIMRKLLHTAFTLVMPRYGVWTSDLDRSAALFGRYYPTWRAAMEIVLRLAREPSGDKAVVLAILDTTGAWLVGEYERTIMQGGESAT
jgi:hypothetical protein